MGVDAKSPARTSAGGITRRELEAVIRRAAELYAADADAAERISEDDLLRIAAELGLPERHVRQALLEVRTSPAESSALDRLLGPAAASGTRVVRGEADRVFDRLHDYLTTREYLRVLRRQGGVALFEPADDAISKMARIFSRPSGRHHLARAHRVRLAVNALEPGTAHVRLEIDLGDRRRNHAISGAGLGGALGVSVGGGLAAVAAVAAADVAGDAGAIAAAALTFGGTFTALASAGLALARARFRRRLDAARLEIDGLLDRMESGESLDPPPAPWRHRLLTGLSPRPSR